MVFQGLVEYWKWLANDAGDIRSNQLAFIKNPTAVVCAVIAYLVMVIVGPRLMEKRNPLEIRKVLIVYNFFSVVFSMWMVWEFFATSFLNPDFNVFCPECNKNDTSPQTSRLINAHWWYVFSKFIEFLDTFFIVARKKNNQISFLHVYHHASMLLLQWLLIKFTPGSVAYFGAFLNSIIHSIMYAYYMLSSFGPHMQKYLWWKRYLTSLQMYQFVLVFFYCSNLIVSATSQLTYVFAWVYWFYTISLFWLFNHFYQNAYVLKKKTETHHMETSEKCKGE